MKKNKIVKFTEEDHSYWNGKKQLTSVNGLLSNFGFEFDKEYWLVYKALQANVPNFNKLYFSKGFNYDLNQPTVEQLTEAFDSILSNLDICLGEIVASIQDEWNQSATKGTLFHHDREQEAYDNGYIINPFDGNQYVTRHKPKTTKGYQNTSSLEFLSNLEDGAYTELLVFLFPHLIAGQADEVFIETIDNIRYFDIGDHKTNKKKPTLNKKNGTCYFPLEHLYDCTFVKYQLQLSMYAYLLSLYGYKPRNIGIYHYTDYDVNTKSVITFKYLKKECEDILYTHLENINN